MASKSNSFITGLFYGLLFMAIFIAVIVFEMLVFGLTLEQAFAGIAVLVCIIIAFFDINKTSRGRI